MFLSPEQQRQLIIREHPRLLRVPALTDCVVCGSSFGRWTGAEHICPACDEGGAS